MRKTSLLILALTFYCYLCPSSNAAEEQEDSQHPQALGFSLGFMPEGMSREHTRLPEREESKGESLPSPEQRLGAYIKETLANVTPEYLLMRMDRHLQQMQLRNAQGGWNIRYFYDIKRNILPRAVTISDFEKLVDQMVICAERNPYLHDLMAIAEQHHFPKLQQKVWQEGDRVFPDVMAFAMVLDNLTKAMRQNVGFYEACYNFWSEARQHSSSGLTYFGTLKLFSIEKLIVERLFPIFKSKKLDPQFCSYVVPLNVLEATLEDAFLGNVQNASAGWVLAQNPPGGDLDGVTGAGPARFSPDQKAIVLCMPFAKEWANLYTAWNSVFVIGSYSIFPYFMVKLLVPSVNDYQEIPGEYLHNRAIALYGLLNFFYFGKSGTGDITQETFDWSDAELTNLLGHINARNAEHYQSLVQQANPPVSWETWIGDILLSPFKWLGLI